MMSQQEETKQPHGKGSREDLLIEQVRVELESYFAPQNIQNDYNLRQKMTTDGFIDINLLLDLKLMQDLVTNRDLLIEAISRSKLLKMNTGCTMVKYMPILERNILILRDIPDKTMKGEILEIFNNEHCSSPLEVHSDIGNHWFCQFQTEEECLATAQYLNLHGTFKGEKLHVRVKAIHDKNKADTSPQMQNAGSSKSQKGRANGPPAPPQPYGPTMPYSPGQWYAYYGTGAVADYGFAANNSGYPGTQRGGPHRARPKSKRAPASDADQSKANGVGSVSPPPSPSGGRGAMEEKATPTSDYPGVFDKYPMETFLEIYREMDKRGDLELPQSMRGRDLRIISDEKLLPVAVGPVEETKGDEDGGRGRKRKKRRKRRKEMKGYYYEDEAFEQNGQLNYYEEDYQQPAAYYYEDEEFYFHEQGPRGGRGRGRRGRGRRPARGADDWEQLYDEDTKHHPQGQGREQSPRGGGRRNRRDRARPRRADGQGGTRQRTARQYNSRRRPETASPENGQKSKRKRNPRAPRTQPKEVWAPKGANKAAAEETVPAEVEESNKKAKGGGGGGRAEEKWVKKSTAPKQYATQKGVYQAKSPSSSQ